MLPESEWSTLFELFASVDGDGAALLRVVRKSLPGVALGFVSGGVS
jgi:hypothetical protein